MSYVDHRRNDIQGLRGIAVLLVIFYHIGLASSNGFIGVDIFFVISGYVISESVFRAIQRTGTFSVNEFLSRRFWRLFPALAVMTGVVFLFAYFVTPIRQLWLTFYTGVSGLLGFSNLYLGSIESDYFAPDAGGNPFLHTWSLGVEAQFYLVFAFIVLSLFVLRKRGHLVLLRVLLVVIGLVAFGSAILALNSEPGVLMNTFFDPLSRIWEFAAGIGAFLVTHFFGIGIQRQSFVANLLGFVGVGGVVSAIILVDSSEVWPNPFTFLVVIGSVALLISGVNDYSLVGKVLASKPLAWVGTISYSLYLWHWPGVVLARQIAGTPLDLDPSFTSYVVGVVVSSGFAVFSYYFIEERFKGYSQIDPKHQVRQALALGVSISIPAVGLASILFLGGSYFLIQKWHDLEEWPAFLSCNAAPPHFQGPDGDPFTREECRFESNTTNSHPIFLVGDSTAGAMSSGFIGAGRILDRPIVVNTGSGCTPFPRGAPGCDAYMGRVFDHLKTTAQPSTVVFSFGANIAFGRDEIRIALSEKVDLLTSFGHEVFIVQPLYNFDKPLARDAWGCSQVAIVGQLCPSQFSIQQAGKGDLATRSMIQKVLSETDARVINLDPYQCPQGSCDLLSGALRKYADTMHISEEWSKALSPVLAEQLLRGGNMASR